MSSSRDNVAKSRLTSDTLNKFFCRKIVRPGKLIKVTRAGWFCTSGVQYTSMLSRAFFAPVLPPDAAAFASLSASSLSLSPCGHHSKSTTPSIFMLFFP